MAAPARVTPHRPSALRAPPDPSRVSLEPQCALWPLGLDARGCRRCWVHWEQPGMPKHPESVARNRGNVSPSPGWLQGLGQLLLHPCAAVSQTQAPHSPGAPGTVCDGQRRGHSSKVYPQQDEGFLARARGTELRQMEKPNTHPKRRVVDLRMVYFLHLT